MKEAGVGTSLNPTSRGPRLHPCLPLFPADAAGSQQVSRKTLAVLSNCSISLAHAEEATNIRHIGFTLQLLPIAERPQETEWVPVGIHHIKRLAATQKVSLPHPKAPVRTLPKRTTRTIKNRIPREVICWVSISLSLSPPRGIFSTSVVRKQSLKDNSVESTQDRPGFPHSNYSPSPR